MSKNEKLLESFTEYCKKYPELRFWQALIGWADVGFIYVSKDLLDTKDTGVYDTFYFENKNN